MVDERGGCDAQPATDRDFRSPAELADLPQPVQPLKLIRGLGSAIGRTDRFAIASSRVPDRRRTSLMAPAPPGVGDLNPAAEDRAS
jgi:hypothetical protein